MTWHQLFDTLAKSLAIGGLGLFAVIVVSRILA
jgi:hypothetical protein